MEGGGQDEVTVRPTVSDRGAFERGSIPHSFSLSRSSRPPFRIGPSMRAPFSAAIGGPGSPGAGGRE